MIGSIGSNRAEAFEQTRLVDRAELIEDNLSRLPLKTNGHTRGIRGGFWSSSAPR